MNGAFLHLAVNHIPVIGVPIAFLLMAYGMARKSSDVIRASLGLLVIMALAAVVAWRTGGPAAHIARDIPGITREDIHEHAEAGEHATVGGGVLGVLAIAGLWFMKRPEGAPKVLLGLILIGSLFMSMWFGWVAHLGGVVRHPEIESGYQPSPPAAPLAMNPPAHH